MSTFFQLKVLKIRMNQIFMDHIKGMLRMMNRGSTEKFRYAVRHTHIGIGPDFP